MVRIKVKKQLNNKIKRILRALVNNKLSIYLFGLEETKEVLKDLSNKDRVYKNYYKEVKY